MQDAKPAGFRSGDLPARSSHRSGQVFARHECRHVLVQDDDGSLIGIISSDTFPCEAIRDFDDVSASWHQRIVESLIAVPLEVSETPGDRTKPKDPRRIIGCVEVTRARI